MPSLFLTVLQTTLVCAQLAGAAADGDHGAVVVDLTLVDRAGAPFTGPLSLRLRQHTPGGRSEWTTAAIEFECDGRLEQTVVGLGAVDPGWAVWARVEREAAGPQHDPRTTSFHGDRDAPCRGTASLRIPPRTARADGWAPPRLRGTLVVEETPVFGRVRIVGAEEGAAYRLRVWGERQDHRGLPGDERPSSSFDVSAGPEPCPVRSTSRAESVRFHVLDPAGRLVHEATLARGGEVTVDPTRAGHVLVDAGGARGRVFVVPAAEHAPPTGPERANRLAAHLRIGRIGAHECWFDAQAGAHVAECLEPGVHVVEVWRAADVDAPPYAPRHIGRVEVRPGEAARYDVP